MAPLRNRTKEAFSCCVQVAVVIAATALMAACTTPALPPAGSAAPEAEAVDLSPAQALTPQAQGVRVRWSGGINTVDADGAGRQCFTLLHATFDAQHVLQWPRNAQRFVACGHAYDDQNLVAPFTLVSIDGHVAGQERLQGETVPRLEIDALYRHSDCLQGDEKLPECHSGFVAPTKP